MLKFWSKLTVLSGFIGVALLLAPSTIYAQIDVPSQSAAEFAEKKLGSAKTEQLISVFRGGKSLKVACGSVYTMCNTATQICLKATLVETGWSGLVSSTVERGKCVERKDFNIKEIRKIWAKGAGDSEAERKGLDHCPKEASRGGKTIRCKVSVAENGFLSSNHSTALGIINFDKYKEQVTGSDGLAYQIYMEGDQPTMAYGNEDFEGCEVFPVKVYNMKKCFFCPLAQIVYNAANEVTAEAFVASGKSLKMLIATFFALWLAIMSLQQVYSFTKKDASDFFNEIIKQSFKFLIAFYLLTDASTLFKMFIVPVLTTGMSMGEGISALEIGGKGHQMVKISSIDDIVSNVEEPTAYIRTGEYYDVVVGKGATPLGMRIEQYLDFIQAQLAYIQALGGTLFCVGTRHLKLFSMGIDYFVGGIRLMVMGTIFLLSGLLVSIVFAFYFLDAILQLGLLGVMMPLMIAGWPFKKTSKPASKGLEFLLNSFFVFFFTGFVVSVNITLMSETLDFSSDFKLNTIDVDDMYFFQNKEKGEAYNAQAKAAMNVFETNTKYNSGGGRVINAIIYSLQTQNIAALDIATDIGLEGFLLMIFAGIFGFIFLKEVAPLAGKLASGAVGNISNQIGGRAASIAKGAASKAAAPLSKAYNKAGGAVGLAGAAAKHLGNTISDVATARGKGGSNFGKALAKGGDKLQKFIKKIR